jgi:hypothetical protein
VRARTAALLLLACSCDAQGSVAAAPDAAPDATTDAAVPPGSDDGGATGESGDDGGGGGLPPCIELGLTALGSTDDCVYVGRCPEDCASSAASAYLCAPIPGFVDAAVTYPSVFPGATFVSVIEVADAAYPWDALAYESCGPLSCVRWTTADHLDGGSAWPADPCGDAGDASAAWACPPEPGVVPPTTGCSASGQSVGGSSTGIAANAVWCCPPQH